MRYCDTRKSRLLQYIIDWTSRIAIIFNFLKEMCKLLPFAYIRKHMDIIDKLFCHHQNPPFHETILHTIICTLYWLVGKVPWFQKCMYLHNICIHTWTVWAMTSPHSIKNRLKSTLNNSITGYNSCTHFS